ncbi:hypothetical protein MHYP_G00314450 [Metynnis hypsauchen]
MSCFRSPPPLCPLEIEAEKELDRGIQPTPALQHHNAERQQEKEEFKVTFSNKFQVLEDISEEQTIELKWQKVKEVVTSTCQEVLGPKSYTHKEWISAEMLQKIEERRDKKARIARKSAKPERPVKDRNGGEIADEEGQKKRWIEHFQELLNRPAPVNPPKIPPAARDLPINCCAPTKDEIRSAIMQLKNGKSAGPDSIPAEALKADAMTSVELLYPLFCKIWEEEEVPSEWKEVPVQTTEG